MAELIKSRHSIIAAIILCIVILATVIVINSIDQGKNSSPLQVDRRAWFTFDTGTLSLSRFGYGSLYSALHESNGAVIHHFPWTPDKSLDGSDKSAKNYFLIINGPERKWNNTEAKNLLDFITKGGTVLIVLTSHGTLANISSFLSGIGITYEKKKDRGKNDYSAFTSQPERVKSGEGIHHKEIPKFGSMPYLRLSRSMDNRLFNSKGFAKIFLDQSGNPILSILQKKDWDHGKVFILNAVLPGFNGEKRDLLFQESFTKKIVKKYNIDKKLSEKLNEANDKDINPDEGLVTKEIKGQGDELIIGSGFSFLKAFMDFAKNEKRSVIFFDYLKDKESGSEVLSLFSSGAFYAVILVTVLVFAGLIFFVREKTQIESLRESRYLGKLIIPVSEIDPSMMRQARSRFVAQYIQVSKNLKKFRGK